MTTDAAHGGSLKLPRRHAPVLFALLMSVSLSGVLSAVITAVHSGIDGQFFGRWLPAYVLAWSLAFPGVTFAAPKVRRLVERITD